MHRNTRRDDRLRERLSERERQARGYAITPEAKRLEGEVLHLLAVANGRRSPRTTLGVDDVRLAVAAVAWGASRWACIGNDHVYPNTKTSVFVARAGDRVAIRILSVNRTGITEALFEPWIHHAADLKVGSCDPGTFRWTTLTFDHAPSEAEILADDTRGWTGFRSNFASVERLVRSGSSWSLESAKAFSAEAANPAPADLSASSGLALTAFLEALEDLRRSGSAFLAFPFEEMANRAGELFLEVAKSEAFLDDDLLQWGLRSALPSMAAEREFMGARSGRPTAGARKAITEAAFDAARRFADSVAPISASRRFPLVLRPVAEWTLRRKASRNPAGDLDRVRRRAEAGDPEALRRYKAMVLARAFSILPWEDAGFSAVFHEVLEDLRPGSSTRKDAGGWGEVIPSMHAYVGRSLTPQPWGPDQSLIAAGIFTPHVEARREFAWLRDPPLARERELIAVAYVLGWKPNRTRGHLDPVKGVAMSLISRADAEALEERVRRSGRPWVEGVVRAEGPRDEWNRTPLLVERHDGSPLHASGRRTDPGSERTG